MFHRNLLCRICLNESNEIIFMDSYLSDQMNVRIHEALEKVMCLPLIFNDVYPNQICRECLRNLRISYELRIQFEKSESILMKCYKRVHPSTLSTEKKPKTSAPVEVIFGSNKYDLKDLVIVEEPQTTEVNFDGFLSNLGQSISAKFVDKKIGINSNQRSKTPVLSEDNISKNNSSVVNIMSSVNNMKMGRIKGQIQFSLMDQGDYGSFDKSVVLQSYIKKNENMVEEHHQAHSNVEIIEFENPIMSQDDETLEVSSDKNELTAVETEKKCTEGEFVIIDKYIITAENENPEIANEINKNDLKAARRNGKCGKRESILIDQYIIEAENENIETPNEININDMTVRRKRKFDNSESILIDQYIIESGTEDKKIVETANDENGLIAVGSKQKFTSKDSIIIDQYIIQAESDNLEIANEKSENGLIAVESKKKYNGESRLIDEYIIEAGNNVQFDVSEEPDIPESLQLQIIAADDELRQKETCEKQQANMPRTCKICKLKFQTRHSYSYHRLTKHSEQKFMCDFCGIKFYTNGSLSRHMLSHTDKTTVLCICPVCGKTFHYKGGLFYHMKQHTNERKYGCDYCDRRFYSSTSKKRHLATHTGDRPYSCSACNKKFFSSGELGKHKYSHTVERPHHCEFCGKGFTSRFNMNIHLFSHPGDFICEFCNRGFITEDVLMSHYRSKHKNCIVEEAGNS